MFLQLSYSTRIFGIIIKISSIYLTFLLSAFLDNTKALYLGFMFLPSKCYHLMLKRNLRVTEIAFPVFFVEINITRITMHFLFLCMKYEKRNALELNVLELLENEQN